MVYMSMIIMFMYSAVTIDYGVRNNFYHDQLCHR